MFDGRTVLVVETEFMIALGIEAVLEARFSSDVVIARNPAEAMARSADWANAWLAIVELEINRPELIELARQISQSGIPVLGFSANMDLKFGVPDLPGTPVVIKPIPDSDLEAAIRDCRRQYPFPDVT